MTLDSRARQAAQGVRRAVEVMEMTTRTDQPQKIKRFDAYRDRKQRNRRVGAFVVAAAVTIAIIAAATGAFSRADSTVPANPPIDVSSVGALREIAHTPTTGLAFRMSTGNGVLAVGTGNFGEAPDGDRLEVYPYPCGGTDVACEPLWTAVLDAPGLPTVDGDAVYVRGLNGSTLYAFATGCGTGGTACSPIWTANIGKSKTNDPPLVADGRVYVFSERRLLAFDVDCNAGGETCAPIWSETVPDVRKLAYADGALYVGTGKAGTPDAADRGDVYAYQSPCPLPRGCQLQMDIKTGQVWDLAAEGDTLLVGTNGASTRGIQAYRTGCQDRSQPCVPLWVGATRCCTQLSLSNGVVYAHDHISSVYAFKERCATDRSVCEPMWTGSPVVAEEFVDFSRPIRAGDVVFVGGAGGSIYAYPTDCTRSCKPVWSAQVGDGTGDEDATVLDDHLYVAANDGLHVYGTEQAASTTNSFDLISAVAIASVLIAGAALVVALVRRRTR